MNVEDRSPPCRLTIFLSGAIVGSFIVCMYLGISVDKRYTPRKHTGSMGKLAADKELSIRHKMKDLTNTRRAERMYSSEKDLLKQVYIIYHNCIVFFYFASNWFFILSSR